jgi:hypothetical protein
MRIRPAPLPRLNDGAVEASLALTLDDAAGRVLAVSTSPARARAGTTPDSKTRFAGDAGLSPMNVLSLLSAEHRTAAPVCLREQEPGPGRVSLLLRTTRRRVDLAASVPAVGAA